MDYGEWTDNSRGTYNKWDGVSRCTTQVSIVGYHICETFFFLLSSILFQDVLCYVVNCSLRASGYEQQLSEG
jgi:hypothetical protein